MSDVDVINALRACLARLTDDEDASARRQSRVIVEQLGRNSEPAVLAQALYQLGAAARRAEKSERDSELVSLMRSWYDELDQRRTVLRQQAFNRERALAEQTVVERVREVFTTRPAAPMRPSDVAATVGADKYQVSRALTRLHKEGFLALAPVAAGADRRGRWYVIAPALAKAARAVLLNLASELEEHHPEFAREAREVVDDEAVEEIYISTLRRHLS